MFGAGSTLPQVTPSSSAAALPDVTTTPQQVMAQSVDKEGLFASWVREYGLDKLISSWIKSCQRGNFKRGICFLITCHIFEIFCHMGLG